jgi:hypothetical protein
MMIVWTKKSKKIPHMAVDFLPVTSAKEDKSKKKLQGGNLKKIIIGG